MTTLVSDTEIFEAIGSDEQPDYNNGKLESLEQITDAANNGYNGAIEDLFYAGTAQGDTIADIKFDDPFEALAMKERIFGKPIVHCIGENIHDHIETLKLLHQASLQALRS